MVLDFPPEKVIQYFELPSTLDINKLKTCLTLMSVIVDFSVAMMKYTNQNNLRKGVFWPRA